MYEAAPGTSLPEISAIPKAGKENFIYYRASIELKMISSIQVHKETKEELAQLKNSPSDTYEQVIKELINEKKKSELMVKESLKEGYREMNNDSKNTQDEWSPAEPEWE